MESIIASQKIGKRRPALRPSRILRARDKKLFLKGPAAYPSIVADREIVAARFPGLRSRPQRVGSRLSGARARIGLAIRRVLARMSGPKQAFILALAVAAALAALVVVLAAGPAFPMPDTGLLPAEDSVQNLLLDYVAPELSDGKADAGDAASALPPVPATLELSTYTVRPSDSLSSIAKRFGLRVDTIISANGISSSSSVKTGTQLRVPNIDGIIEKVRPGESLASLAKRFNADSTRIVDANDLGSAQLLAGQSLFIPGAKLPDSAVKMALSQMFAWPARGPLSSFFGYRPDPFTGVRTFHAGIDIVVDAGTTIRAAMGGTVADVGYNANYGNYVILSHPNGFQTLYGHLTSYSVAAGMAVSQGTALGLSGNTGYSTGPHLHFGIFRRSAALNPLKYLK